MTDDGVHVELAARPTRDCPAAALARDYPVRGFVDGDAGNAPQVVVEASADADLGERAGVTPVLAADGTVVCRVPALAESEPAGCDHGHCLFRGLGFLPVQPYRRQWVDGRLQLSIAATDRGAVAESVARLDEAGFETTTERIVHSDARAGSDTAVVDLDTLTDRQREVADLAADCGYFSSDSPPADDLASKLGISRGTFSGHLRAAEATLFAQVFGNESRENDTHDSDDDT
ncbi:HTH DNA binding domain-containing protein [Halogranum gelatinilyticum]|uniref:HTH DNA binding domain-containing protein n=1 Tax=Halogranum gelatinilyticum TaxID=660521 RepID=A0A1G9WA38_9EURY|nr:helix-turn-helix domain-containing protein [Halogranum gelatinilyticum]SDM81133.1 HTH DNA binding domain-containing protein [Halogranum gelatinilyticum]